MPQSVGDIESFIARLQPCLDDDCVGLLTPEATFRDLPGWNSLLALIVVASFDEHYGATISSEEFQRAKTIADLYALVLKNRSA